MSDYASLDDATLQAEGLALISELIRRQALSVVVAPDPYNVCDRRVTAVFANGKKIELRIDQTDLIVICDT